MTAPHRRAAGGQQGSAGCREGRRRQRAARSSVPRRISRRPRPTSPVRVDAWRPMVGLDLRPLDAEYAVEYVFTIAGRHAVSASSLCRTGEQIVSIPSVTPVSCRRRSGTSARYRTCWVSSRSTTRTHAGWCCTRASRTAITRCARTFPPPKSPPMDSAALRLLRGSRRGHLRAAGRSDPRRHHRAGPLPLLQHRRADPAPRRAALLHAPRRGEDRRGQDVRTRRCSPWSGPVASARSPMPSPSATAVERLDRHERASAGRLAPHLAARAGAALQPRRRHRQHLRRRRASTSGSSQGAILKERLQRLNEELTGHRFLMGVVGLGGLRYDL